MSEIAKQRQSAESPQTKGPRGEGDAGGKAPRRGRVDSSFTWVLRTGEVLETPFWMARGGFTSLKNLFSGDSNDYREPLVRLASFGV